MSTITGSHTSSPSLTLTASLPLLTLKNILVAHFAHVGTYSYFLSLLHVCMYESVRVCTYECVGERACVYIDHKTPDACNKFLLRNLFEMFSLTFQVIKRPNAGQWPML